MIDFFTNNWFYILLVGFMIFRMVKGGGCCGSHSNSDETQDGHSKGSSCCGGNSDGGHTQDRNTTDIDSKQFVRDPFTKNH